MFNRDDILRVFEECNAIIRDSHLVYALGRHGSTYINKDMLFVLPSVLDLVIANPIADMVLQDMDWVAHKTQGKPFPLVVAGPVVGGAILAHLIADKIASYETGIKCVYADKTPDGGYEFKRGYDRVVANQRVVLVEDVLTTGGSIRKVIDAVRRCGGTVVGVFAVANRGKVSFDDLGIPLRSLIDLDMESWPEEECPLCKQGVPINTEVGKGREYLSKKEKQS